MITKMQNRDYMYETGSQKLLIKKESWAPMITVSLSVKEIHHWIYLLFWLLYHKSMPIYRNTPKKGKFTVEVEPMEVKWGMPTQMDLSSFSFPCPATEPEQVHPRSHTTVFVKCRAVAVGTDMAVSLTTGTMPQAGLAYIFCQGFLWWVIALC